MRTKPRPSQMFLISGVRGNRIHLGYTQKDFKRPLCGAKLSDKSERNRIFKKGKTNCLFCIKRLKRIENMIKKLGVEWVCDGVWVPMEQRTFKDNVGM